MSHKQGIWKRSPSLVPSSLRSLLCPLHLPSPLLRLWLSAPPPSFPSPFLGPLRPWVPPTDCAFPPCPVGGPPGESAVDWCLYQLNGATEFEVSEGEYRGAEVGHVPSTAALAGSVWRNVACWWESGRGRRWQLPRGVGPVGYRRWHVGPGQEGRWAGEGGCRWFACAGPRVSVVLVSWEKLGLAASSLGGTSPLGLGVGGNSCEGGCVVPDGKFSGSPPALEERGNLGSFIAEYSVIRKGTAFECQDEKVSLSPNHV